MRTRRPGRNPATRLSVMGPADEWWRTGAQHAFDAPSLRTTHTLRAVDRFLTYVRATTTGARPTTRARASVMHDSIADASGTATRSTATARE